LSSVFFYVAVADATIIKTKNRPNLVGISSLFPSRKETRRASSSRSSNEPRRTSCAISMLVRLCRNIKIHMSEIEIYHIQDTVRLGVNPYMEKKT